MEQNKTKKVSELTVEDINKTFPVSYAQDIMNKTAADNAMNNGYMQMRQIVIELLSEKAKTKK